MSDTEHFKEIELACFCCGRSWVKQQLLDWLEEVRLIYKKPMIIESGCRCPDYNTQVRGVPGSAHITGEAADVRCVFAQDRLDLIEAFIFVGFQRIGLSRNFIHIDISKTLPQKVLWLYEE